MKQFENKVTSIDTPADPNSPGGKTYKATFADLIIQALKSFRQEGYTVDEMIKRFRIIDALEPLQNKPDGKAKLEDADASHLQQILSEFKWLTVNRDIIALTEHVKNMKSAK